MNILYLAHRIPYPPDKGDKLRAFRQIEHLARRHRVWCACFVDDPRDFRHVRKLRDYCDVCTVEIRPRSARVCGLWSMARGKTITEGFYANRDMTALLAEWRGAIGFDAVVAFSSSMAPYALEVKTRRRILDLCDLDSRKWSDYANHIELKPRKSFRERALAGLYRLEGARLAAAELRWIDGFDAAVLATEIEAAPLRTMVSSRKLHVIGNGVELPGEKNRFDVFEHPAELKASTLTPAPLPEREGGCASVVGFVGVMDYLPNVDAVSWFATQCWPAIRIHFSDASFRIVGRSPTQTVRKLAKIPGIQVVGAVASVERELSRFDVSVAPLRIARGIQNKVLEAMAACKAVVLTPKAAQGIAAADGRDYVVADSGPGFAQAVCSLLADRAARDRIGRSALEFVATHRRWEPELEKFEALVVGGETRISNFKSQIPIRSGTKLDNSAPELQPHRGRDPLLLHSFE